jgi:arsenate reductase
MQSKGAAMTVTIFHNPRCSKSRATLALLRERGIEPDIRLYLEDPPDATELRRVLGQLGLQPRQLMRKGEQEFRELGLADPGLSDDQLVAAMAATPRLIERPIVIANGKAALGRPPESVLEIL